MKQKRILFYGDSILWGYKPADGTRYEFNETITGVMEKELGQEYRIITEALSGRTTCFEVPYAPYRNGKEFLPMLLESHSPLDLVILMLGINDLMIMNGKTAEESAWGLLSLVRIILSPVFGGTPPKILIVSPPVPGRMSTLYEMGYGKSSGEFQKLSGCYKTIAKESISEFINANDFVKVPDADGIHLLSEQNTALGKAISEKVKTIFE